MNNKILLGAVFVVALGIGSYFTFGTNEADSVGPTLGAANAQTTDAADVDTSSIVEMVLGAEDAPITVVEYASYTCPHCASFHAGAFKDIKKDYIDTGKVKFVYREIYFDRYGLWGSIIARCGGPEKFFGISDMLYTGQRAWTQGAPADIAGNLRQIGISAGLSADQVDACFSDGQKAQTLVAWFEKNAEADAIRSTPSFLINGNLHSNMSYADFQKILDAQ